VWKISLKHVKMFREFSLSATDEVELAQHGDLSSVFLRHAREVQFAKLRQLQQHIHSIHLHTTTTNRQSCRQTLWRQAMRPSMTSYACTTIAVRLYSVQWVKSPAGARAAGCRPKYTQRTREMRQFMDAFHVRWPSIFFNWTWANLLLLQ